MVSKVGRPKKDDKKIQINVAIPPWLRFWLKNRPESNSNLIEAALVDYYKISKQIRGIK